MALNSSNGYGAGRDTPRQREPALLEGNLTIVGPLKERVDREACAGLSSFVRERTGRNLPLILTVNEEMPRQPTPVEKFEVVGGMGLEVINVNLARRGGGCVRGLLRIDFCYRGLSTSELRGLLLPQPGSVKPVQTPKDSRTSSVFSPRPLAMQVPTDPVAESLTRELQDPGADEELQPSIGRSASPIPRRGKRGALSVKERIALIEAVKERYGDTISSADFTRCLMEYLGLPTGRGTGPLAKSLREGYFATPMERNPDVLRLSIPEYMRRLAAA